MYLGCITEICRVIAVIRYRLCILLRNNDNFVNKNVDESNRNYIRITKQHLHTEFKTKSHDIVDILLVSFQNRLASSRAPSLFKLANANLARSALLTTTANKNVVLKPVQQENYDGLNHDEKNRALKRQLSPCLSIYEYQLTTVLSITHRATGMLSISLRKNAFYCGKNVSIPYQIICSYSFQALH